MTTQPYVAVIFTNQRTDTVDAAYERAAQQMVELAEAQPGFVGVDSVRGDERVGITVSYWESEEHALGWKQQQEHLAAQHAGRELWYSWYRVRVATVTREYSYDHGHASGNDDADDR